MNSEQIKPGSIAKRLQDHASDEPLGVPSTPIEQAIDSVLSLAIKEAGVDCSAIAAEQVASVVEEQAASVSGDDVAVSLTSSLLTCSEICHRVLEYYGLPGIRRDDGPGMDIDKIFRLGLVAGMTENEVGNATSIAEVISRAIVWAYQQRYPQSSKTSSSERDETDGWPEGVSRLDVAMFDESFNEDAAKETSADWRFHNTFRSVNSIGYDTRKGTKGQSMFACDEIAEKAAYVLGYDPTREKALLKYLISQKRKAKPGK